VYDNVLYQTGMTKYFIHINALWASRQPLQPGLSTLSNNQKHCWIGCGMCQTRSLQQPRCITWMVIGMFGQCSVCPLLALLAAAACDLKHGGVPWDFAEHMEPLAGIGRSC
jgi:hypothetical protein